MLTTEMDVMSMAEVVDVMPATEVAGDDMLFFQVDTPSPCLSFCLSVFCV